ncbi:hypothetical protein MCUN1_001942 [Malassezia cuniculi]|uniref:Sodium/calcium exchanger membrane region domain-containing protein n=1 Tax=Malassezia cuniculi TaxID=948313 RepID=A0AAF0EYT9_9BASI|nr:hypothetical protein MCUN1_001942 [Malassezia cuniculi]
MTLGLIASEFFSANLELLGRSLGINDSTMGVTFLALGNALPDLFSSFRAIQTGAGNLGVGVLTGAALFLVTVVGGGVMIVRPFRVHPAPFFRDTGIFFLGTSIMFGCLYRGAITLAACFWLIGLFVAFVALVIATRGCDVPEAVPLLREPCETCDAETPVTAGHRSLLAAVEISAIADSVKRSGYSSINSDAFDAVDPARALVLQRGGDTPNTIGTPQLDGEGDPSAFHIISHALFPTLCHWSDRTPLEKLVAIASVPPMFVLRATVPAPAGISERVENISHPAPHAPQAEAAEGQLLNALHCSLSPAFMVWASGVSIASIPQWTLVCAASIAGILGRHILDHKVPRSMIGFVAGALWIFITVDEVVHMFRLLGTLIGWSETLLGLTVFTFGNSLGDVSDD